MLFLATKIIILFPRLLYVANSTVWNAMTAANGERFMKNRKAPQIKRKNRAHCLPMRLLFHKSRCATFRAFKLVLRNSIKYWGAGLSRAASLSLVESRGLGKARYWRKYHLRFPQQQNIPSSTRPVKNPA